MGSSIDVITPLPDDHVDGNPEAPLLIVEYGDYECPICVRAQSVVALMRRDPQRVRFVYRHFPLSDAHPFAEPAAEAAEAAAAQGVFWRYHELLYQRSPHLEPATLVAIARECVPDVSRFERELRERVHAPRVLRDLEDGRKRQIRATPTFFVGTRRFEGSGALEPLLSLVRAASGT